MYISDQEPHYKIARVKRKMTNSGPLHRSDLFVAERPVVLHTHINVGHESTPSSY